MEHKACAQLIPLVLKLHPLQEPVRLHQLADDPANHWKDVLELVEAAHLVNVALGLAPLKVHAGDEEAADRHEDQGEDV